MNEITKLNLFPKTVYFYGQENIEMNCALCATKGKTTTILTIKTMHCPICLPIKLDSGALPAVCSMTSVMATHSIKAVPAST